MFYDRLKKVCDENNTNMTALSKRLKFSSGNISKWKNGGIPKSETLVLIAKELSISTDYLLGLDDKPSQKENSKPLSKNEKECMEKFKLLTETEQGKILDRMDVFIEEREAKRKGA